MYDIVGDVHGHASRLESLLRKLGYEHDGYSWKHDSRRVLFVGDFIDRGPEQIETYKLVRAMVDHGSALAVMGNHEFNAVCYATPDPRDITNRLRPHTEKHMSQHAEFIRQVGEGTSLHQEMINWFKTLPLYLDLDELRVIHACWEDNVITAIDRMTDSNQCLHEWAWQEASRKSTEAYNAVETALKGLEIDLPGGARFIDKGGFERRAIRTRWWSDRSSTYRSIAMMDDQACAALPSEADQIVPETELPGYQDTKLIFFGHYWLKGKPAPMSDRVACVDYTVTLPPPEGKLVAYRWSGESQIREDAFVWI